jgi:long-chain fatty acid transport protein
MCKRSSGVLVLVLASALAPARARAGGEEFPDHGAEALSRGGAFTAKADDLSALVYNVAGLAWVRGTRLLVSVNLISSTAEFQRAGRYSATGTPYDNLPFPKVSASGGIFPNPIAVVASDFGTKQFTFAGGFYGPSQGKSVTLPSTVTVNGSPNVPAPQRYDLIDDDILVINPTAAVAWRPFSFLSFGAAFHWVYVNPKFHESTYLAPAMGPPEQPNFDYDIHVDVTDSFEPAFSVGALYAPSDAWELGLNYRSGVDIDATGHVTATTGPEPPGKPKPVYDNGQYGLVTHFLTALPAVLRAGGRHIWRDGEKERADVELDVTYERWSASKEVRLDITGLIPQPRQVVTPLEYNDTVSVRAGGAYSFDLPAGRLSIRGGAYYDSAAAPEEYTRLDFRAWDRIGLASGVGYHIGGLSASLGVAYVMMFDRTVTDSKLRQTHTLGGNPDDPSYSIIGNGTFSSGYTVVMLGLEYTFDPFR